MQHINQCSLDGCYFDGHAQTIHDDGEIVRLVRIQQRLRRPYEAAEAEGQIGQLSAPPAYQLNFVEFGIGDAMQFQRRVIAQHAIGAQLAGGYEPIHHQILHRQMRRNSRKNLAAQPLDVAGLQVMLEQAGDACRARRTTESRGKLRPGEHRVGREEGCRPVRAR